MYRLLAAILISSFTAIPTTQALSYQTPSELLRAVEFNGNPRMFSLEAHGHADGMYASSWVYGSAEGETPEELKAKLRATVDVHQDGKTIRSRFKIVVHEQVIYLKLQEMNDSSRPGFMTPVTRQFHNQWIAIPVHEAAMEAVQASTDIENLISEVSAASGPTTVGTQIREIHDFAQLIVDAMMTLERRSFPEGQAYTMHLRPNFLEQIARMMDMMAGIPLENRQHDVEISFLQNILNETMDVSIKVDTDEDGNFEFGRMKVSFAFDDIAFNMEGISVIRLGPVWLEVPEKFILIDEAITTMSTMDENPLDDLLNLAIGSMDEWDISTDANELEIWEELEDLDEEWWSEDLDEWDEWDASDADLDLWEMDQIEDFPVEENLDDPEFDQGYHDIERCKALQFIIGRGTPC